MKAPTLAQAVAKLTLTKKAADVLIMDLRKLTSVTDFFVVCTADSDIQVKAVADAVEDGMLRKGIRPWHKEAGSANWVLLDYVDVVLHVFHKNTRGYYNLERLWGDAEITAVGDSAPGKAPVRRKSGSRGPAARRKVAT